MELTPSTAAQGRRVVEALWLSDCPVHRVGDRMDVDIPVVMPGSAPMCLVPLQKACALSLGAAEGVLQCQWNGCQGRWRASLSAAPPEPELVEDDFRPFLLQMPQALASELIRAGQERTFAAGTRILEAGCTNEELFLLRDGEVEVLEEREAGTMRIATIRRGDCFGEMSLLAPHPISNATRAVGEVRAIAIAKGPFNELLFRHPLLSLLLVRLLARRLRASNRQLEQILRPGLWGRLELFPFTSIVESIHQSKMTGLLTITRHRLRAVLGFRDGALFHADSGLVSGEDVLVDILGWSDGVFRFQDEAADLPSNVTGDTMAVLFDAVRRFDERERDASGKDGNATDAYLQNDPAQADSMQTLNDCEEDASGNSPAGSSTSISTELLNA